MAKRKRVPDDESPTRVGPSDVVLEARERWLQCQEAEDAQRKSILAAKQFRAGDQWPEAIKTQRQGGGSIEGQAPQPPRPCLTIDRLSQPVRQISNAIRTANFAITVVPNGAGANEETAKIFEGIVRKIQVESRDEAPVEWAAEGAIEGGLGWFRIKPVYCHTDPTVTGPEVFDQELVLERITNSLTVYCDPHAKKPTRADAAFMFVTEDLAKSEFTRRYHTADYASLEEFSATGDLALWVTEDSVRVAEYWRVDYDDVTVCQLATDGSIVLGDAVPDGAVIARSRVVQVPHVTCSVINAVEELKTYDWPGSHIPLIPILGEELNVDGQVVLRGVIQEGMDAQRMVNYMYSAAIETVALAPKAPFIVAEGQVDDYRYQWQTANTRNWDTLTYKPTSLEGQPVPPPQRQNQEPPIQAMVMMLGKSEEAIKATTGLWDASLGNAMAGQKSGRAIRYLQNAGEVGTSNFPDNIHRALVYAGEQLIEVIPKYYDRAGRVLHILGMDQEAQEVTLGQPPQDPALAAGIAQFYDLSQGRYAVTVDVGKGFATKRQESAAILGELITGLPPEIAAAVTPSFIRTMDFPNASEIADIAQRALPPQLQPPSQQPNPQQLQAQMQQMGGAMQQMQQKLMEQQRIIDAKQIESQAKLQEASMELASKKEIELIKLAGQMAQTDAKLDAENARTFVEAAEAKIGKLLELHLASVHQATEHLHDVRQQALAQAHEHALAQSAPQPIPAAPNGDAGMPA